MPDKKTNLKDAIMDLARGIETVFRKYTRQTREKAWEKVTGKDGEREIKKIIVDPNRQLSAFGKLANQRESQEFSGLRLWVDDERPLPNGFDLRVETAGEAIRILSKGGVSIVSLDHDLGEGGGTGYEVAKYMEEAAFHGRIPYVEAQVHSANPVGAANIRRCITNANKYWGAK